MKTKATGERPFWDTSAIVPLCCRQGASDPMRRLLRADRRLAVWWGTVVEAHSALRRLVREGAMTDKDLGHALDRLDLLRRSWSEVQPGEQVRHLALGALDRHALRSADAIQLAAALVLCDEKPRRRPFVCLDDRLAAAAEQAGFSVLPRRRR